MWGGLKARLLVWRAVFVGPWKWLVVFPLGLLGIFQGIRDEFLSPSWQDKLRLPAWLPDWSWQTWITFAAIALLVALLEGVYQFVRDKHTARLELGRVVVDVATETIQGVLNAPRYDARYIKIEARAIAEVIERCTPYVSRLRRHINGQWSECEIVDPIALKWSSGGGASTIDLTPTMPRFVDLLKCNEDTNALSFCPDVPIPVKAAGFFLPHGRYLLTVHVHSASGLASPSVDVAVIWSGDYSAVTAQRVAES